MTACLSVAAADAYGRDESPSGTSGVEHWICESAPGRPVDSRRLEFDPGRGEATLVFDGTRIVGRYAHASGHIAARFDDGTTVRELIFGTVTGRVQVRTHGADGIATTEFFGRCRRVNLPA